MNIRRAVLLPVFFLLFFGAVLAYDNQVIHPRLTETSVELYNRQKDKQINNQQKDWMVQGAIAEDTDPRYLNHFYNPITNQGLGDSKTAKDWALYTQEGWGGTSGDYSLPAILENYEQGNQKRAWQGVGHILHLLQDMSVPAHVRVDPHPPLDEDPFETWAKQNGHPNIARADFVYVADLAQAFDNLSSHTYNNFFSKDTVYGDLMDNASDFRKEINLDGNEVEYIYYNDYRLVEIRRTSVGNEYFFDFKVNLDYWNMLSPQAVGYSAGVIDYFVREFEKIDQAKSSSNLGFFQKINNWIDVTVDKTKSATKYVFGDGFLAGREKLAKKLGFGFDTAIEAEKNLNYFAQAEKELVAETAQVAKEKADQTVADMKTVSTELAKETKEKAEDIKDDILGKVLGEAEANDNVGTENEQKNIESNTDKSKIPEPKIGIERVVDGDTILLTTGEYVRYIGIDTPELGKAGSEDDECLAWVAKIRNISILASGELTLVKDPGMDKDKYGRLLRYVYAGDVFVNQRIALEGLAEVFFCQEGWENCPVAQDKARENIIRQAVEEAEQAERGLYSGVCDPDTKDEVSLIILDELEEKTEKVATTTDLVDILKKDFMFVHTAPGPEQAKTEQNTNTQETATTTNETATTTNETATTTTETATTTEETATTTIIEVLPKIINFVLNSLTSSSTTHTASSTVGIGLEIEKPELVDKYFLSTNSDIPELTDSAWATTTPQFYIFTETEEEKELYLYIQTASTTTASSTIADMASTTIMLDKTPPLVPEITNLNLNKDFYWINSIKPRIAGTKELGVNQINLGQNQYQATSTEDTWEILDYEFDFPCVIEDDIERMQCVEEYCTTNPENCPSEEMNMGELWQKQLTISAFDLAGNMSSQEDIYFALDTKKPMLATINTYRSNALDFVYSISIAVDYGLFYHIMKSGVKDYFWQLKQDDNWTDITFPQENVDGYMLNKFSGQYGNTYIFRVQAEDYAKNRSEWSEEITITMKNPYPVLSEVYAGGGNSGSIYRNDFVELYNPSNQDISLDGYSVQYAPAQSDTWQVANISGNIKAHGYYLISLHQGENETAELPTPDSQADINLAVSAGKVALVKNQEAITGKDDPEVADFLGYGTTATEHEGGTAWYMTNEKSIERRAFLTSTQDTMAIGGAHQDWGNGWDEDNNMKDWVRRDVPEPQNSGADIEMLP